MPLKSIAGLLPHAAPNVAKGTITYSASQVKNMKAALCIPLHLLVSTWSICFLRFFYLYSLFHLHCFSVGPLHVLLGLLKWSFTG